MIDSELRPKGSVELECSSCELRSWYDPVSQEVLEVADGKAFLCDGCIQNKEVSTRCKACNRSFKLRHRDFPKGDASAHLRCPDCKDIPPRQFAKVVHCWSTLDNQLGVDCPNLATQVKRWPKDCECEACWQDIFHLCDEHAEEWLYDKTPLEQQAILRQRGAKVHVEADGSWWAEWPREPVFTDN